MALPSLPDDVLREVFSRTSLETLGRIRMLGKEWNQMTYDSTFNQQFRERTKTISGFFIQIIRHWGEVHLGFVSIDDDDENREETEKVSLSFLPPGPSRSSPVYILASTPQGILLCQKHTQYYVCKPTTKQWQAIPNPNTRYQTRGIGMMVLRSNPLRYKIVRFSDRRHRWNDNKSGCDSLDLREVFDSETCAWKQFKGDKGFPYALYLDNTTAVVSACGRINWLTPDNHIYAFDLNTESCEIFALPEEVTRDCEDPFYERVMEIVGYEGRLGLVCMGEDDKCMRLWVMKDYGHKKVWRKRKEVYIEELTREEILAYPVLAFCNADVVLMQLYDKLMFYKFENYGSTSTTTTSSKVVPWGFHTTCCQVFPLESDFEPVYLGPKLPLPDHKSVLSHTSLLGTCYRRALNWSINFLLLCILVTLFVLLVSFTCRRYHP